MRCIYPHKFAGILTQIEAFLKPKDKKTADFYVSGFLSIIIYTVVTGVVPFKSWYIKYIYATENGAKNIARAVTRALETV